MRYSSGSAADPQLREPNWNRSFELPADAPVGGVLLLHGMSDSPYSLRALGEALNRHDYWVIGCACPGTAPHPRDSHRQLGGHGRRGAAGHGAPRVQGRSRSRSTSSAIRPGPPGARLRPDALEGTTAPVPASLVLISPAIGIHPAAALARWKRRLVAPARP